jgi:hypothetical protein
MATRAYSIQSSPQVDTYIIKRHILLPGTLKPEIDTVRFPQAATAQYRAQGAARAHHDCVAVAASIGRRWR